MIEQKIQKYLRSTVFYDEKKEKYEAIASPSLNYRTPTKTKTIFNAGDLLYLAKREEKEEIGKLSLWTEAEYVERDEEEIYILRGILSNLNCRVVIELDEKKEINIEFGTYIFLFNEQSVKIIEGKNEKTLLKKPVKRNPRKKELKIDKKDFENFVSEFLESEGK